ncbi:MAG: 7-cyano-7-deazaguanine synthase QueC [Muribaculum sp.]|nr:7-cyano-7-deazaguanine synthase QueC [Muribaculum sp.]
MTKDSIIVLSGGLDSVTLLHDYKDRIAMAVTFDYGSNHNRREAMCAQQHCKELGIEFALIPLGFMHLYFKSSLLDGAEFIPEGNYDDSNMKSTVVPFRNGVMLSVACGIAASNGLRHVLIANHGGDHTIYPDCRPEFIESMSRAMSYGTFENIDILAPYTEITKTDIARIGKRLGLDYSNTYSCYKGGEHHCGRCGTCRERHEALRDAGIEDPTVYDHNPEG